MAAKKGVRVALDVALTVMIVFEMLIQFTGEFLHEVVGFAFFACVVMHIALSASWVKKTARNAKAGNITARRTALVVVGSLLAITTVALGVSSIAISGILASAGLVWPIGSYSTWATVHTFSAYALCALVVVHLAMHWAFLASALRVPYSPSRRRAISAGVNAVATVGVLALGVTAAGKMMPQAANTGSERATSNADSASTSSSASSAGTSPTDKSDRTHKKMSDGAAFGSSASSPSAEASPNGESTGNAGNSSTTSGICTLCRKQCSLSAPKCDKPYEMGLLS